jgi:hypothetical protein
MRLALSRLALVLLLLVSGMARAQSPAAVNPPSTGSQLCEGVSVRVRVSYIKPGMMPLFEKAVAAQQAWYDGAAGPGKHQILLGKVVDTSLLSEKKSFSESQALTYHVYPAGMATAPPSDEAYKAFVKMYSDSSSIKYEYLTCMTKAPM